RLPELRAGAGLLRRRDEAPARSLRGRNRRPAAPRQRLRVLPERGQDCRLLLHGLSVVLEHHGLLHVRVRRSAERERRRSHPALAARLRADRLRLSDAPAVSPVADDRARACLGRYSDGRARSPARTLPHARLRLTRVSALLLRTLVLSALRTPRTVKTT